jgi:hypothetical protein
MAVGNIELYEALKGTLGQETATMLTEAIGDRTALTTKADLAELRAEFRVAMAQQTNRLVLWMFGLLTAATLAIIWTR